MGGKVASVVICVRIAGFLLECTLALRENGVVRGAGPVPSK